ncbi:6443_t:CDS:2 [Gigaspora margarita]|uniref:6443_t:CDS:1 n=1 Tax=Gigaspora margarita TaxID=4874 RepID=A0ABN7VKC4_GIGMA|nr:6443_t:CDS:2 [Gigaspora margarita]
MQSTQRVEGQNTIIKNSVNSNTSLINFSKHVNEQIDLDEQFESNKLSNLTKAFDIFIEEAIDAPAILLNDFIPPTEVESVLEV